jgi:platelet-activating factor acetylhydrolase IB subunit alpha
VLSYSVLSTKGRSHYFLCLTFFLLIPSSTSVISNTIKQPHDNLFE